MEYSGRVFLLMWRVNSMDTGMVNTMHTTSGGDMMSIIIKLPSTVTRLVTICTTSVERLTVTTSMS